MPRKTDGSRLDVEDRYVPRTSPNRKATVDRRAPDRFAADAIGAAAPGAVAVALQLVLMGPPGSGKSTQARALSRSLDLPHISVGSLLRQEMDRGTELGELVRETVESGDLAPSEVVFQVVQQRLQEADCDRGFIMDGYPREQAQLGPFSRLMEARGYDNLHAIGIEVPDDEVFLRLGKRGRLDDTPEVIRHRLEVFREETEPMIAHYREQGVYHGIDGMGTPAEVAERIAAEVGAWQVASA